MTCTITSHYEMNNKFYIFEIKNVESGEMQFLCHVFCGIKLAAGQVPNIFFLKTEINILNKYKHKH